MTLYRKPEDHSRLILAGLALTLLMVAVFSLYWFAETPRLAQAADEFKHERIVRGEEIYAAQCASCHGLEGEGGIGPALKDRKVLKNTLDEVFFSVIRSGVPNTQMPAWSVDFGGPLTDEDIRDTVALMRSWEDSAPEIEPVVFVADDTRGALLFANTCAVCHGENGLGLADAPAINDPQRLQSFSDDWYRDVIRNGRPAKGMPTWGTVLSPNQIEDLLALVDAWRSGNEVLPDFEVSNLLDAAIFSLTNDDPQSASLQVDRAIQASSGISAETMRNAQSQIKQGDLAGALATVQALRENWPLGDPVNGGDLYTMHCLACHGAQGEGGIGTALKPNVFVQGLDNTALVQFLAEGRVGTAMAGFADRLTDQELADLVAWLRQWQK